MEIFKYYKLDLGQLHLNGSIIFFVFDKFFRLIKIELTINVFSYCYHQGC